MKIRVEIISEVDAKNNPEGARQAVHVATHSRRGEMFNVDKSDSVMEGSDMVFDVPVGGRLVVTTPQTHEEYVYDSAQAAAVRASSQVNTESRADQVDLAQVAKDKQAEADRAKEQLDQRERDRKASDKPAPEPTGTNPAVTAAQQQSMQGRAPGEKPPLPGSPVGSPPAGNTGSGASVGAQHGAAKTATPTVNPTKDK